MKITKPGIYPDVPTAAYFADPCPVPSFTQSLAKTMIEYSPRHVWTEHPRLNPDYVHDDGDYRKDLAIGNAAHALMLGRGKELAVASFNDWRSSDAKAFKREAIEAGKTAILDNHFDTAFEMVATGQAQLEAMDLPMNGKAEIVIASEEEGGIWLRSMIDMLSDNRRIVIDYKTTGMCCSPFALALKMVSDGFDVQAAFHERILNVLDPPNAGRRQHLFICQENERPYALTVLRLPESVLTIGRKKVDYAVERWRWCVTRDEWPMYPQSILEPEMPQWAETKWLERETTEAIFGENLNILAGG